MNSKGKKIWRYIFVGMIVLYLLAIMVTVVIISKIPDFYLKMQQNEYLRLKNEIALILEQPEVSMREESFSKIENKIPAEFVIFSADSSQIIYTTIPVTNPADLKEMLNPEAISQEEFYVVTVKNTEYQVWVAQYYVSPQDMVNTWVTALILIIVVLFTVLIGIMVFVFYRSLRPLQRLRENIYKISNYQLDKVNKNEMVIRSEQDALSYELAMFSRDLQGKITEAEVTYTSLEKEIQIQNELSEYRAKLLATLSHDLKTPLHTAQLEVERLQKDIEQYDTSEIQKRMAIMQQKITTTMDDINNLIEVVYQDNIEQLLAKEHFDLVQELMAVQQGFTEQMELKDFYCDFDVDEKIEIYANKVRFKQLIHNAISNICEYAPQHANIAITCYQENDVIHMKFYNDARILTSEQLENIFKLFYRISDSKHGSGYGLYTTREIAHENGGEVTFENKGNGVELAFIFQKGILSEN